MAKFYPFISNDNKSFRDIFHFAKQRKFSFFLVILMLLLNFNSFILTFGARLQPHMFMAINNFWLFMIILVDLHDYPHLNQT